MVHVICDNASVPYQPGGPRMAGPAPAHPLVFLPKYSPELNPIERIWWHLRDEITRNHRHRTIESLIAATLRWLKHRKHQIEGKAYQSLLAA